jgi:quercetin dioxygenase-like cupin family protein
MLTIEPAGAVLSDTMTISSIKFGRLKLAVAGSLDGWCAADRTGIARGRRRRRCPVKPVLAQTLPNVAGKSLTAVIVTYALGGKSVKHHHAGSVFVFVLSGAIESESSATGSVKVYKAGESFFEPPGSEHLVSENASATAPASLLAIFVADDGAQLTTFDK